MSEAHQKFVAAQVRGNAVPFEIDRAATALLVIDMQEYFLNPQSPFCRYVEARQAGLSDYYLERSRTTVEPNLKRLLDRFRTAVNVWGDAVGAAVMHRFIPQV